jgi:hypothetical protein
LPEEAEGEALAEALGEALAEALADALAEPEVELDAEPSASGRISLAQAVNAASAPAAVAPSATRRFTRVDMGEGLVIISLSKEVNKGNRVS